MDGMPTWEPEVDQRIYITDRVKVRGNAAECCAGCYGTITAVCSYYIVVTLEGATRSWFIYIDDCEPAEWSNKLAKMYLKK